MFNLQTDGHGSTVFEVLL